MSKQEIKPGQRVCVRQEIDRREGNWEHAATGVVVSVEAESTGSWLAHGQDGKLWLSRLRLRKEDGELTTIVVDRNMRIEVLADA